MTVTPDLSPAALVPGDGWMDRKKMRGGENSVQPLSRLAVMMILCDVVEHHCADVSNLVCNQ